ncbi:MAG: sialidase family protein, partial [Candidatus Lutacidiplasmatales archaeon]
MVTGAHTGRVRRTSRWAILVLVAGLVLWGAPAFGHANPTGPATPSSGPHRLAPSVSHTSVAPIQHPDAAAHPGSVTNVTLGTVYNSTLIAPASASNIPCYWQNFTPFDYHYCYSETQSPSILSLSNGQLGLAYSIYTVQGPLCNTSTNTTPTSWTSTNVAWAHSATNGTTWSAAQIVGAGTCRWPSSGEPSFATGPHGSVYGAFILSNNTTNASGGNQPLFPPDWGNGTGDALGFVSSSDNGTTWTNTTEVPGVTGAARPSLAVFGNTVYVTYIFVPNTTASYPIGNFFGNTPAPAVELVYSVNGGSTWSAPYTLPGLNASMGNWSTSPSIAVNSAGTVAVAYATNRTCVGYCAFAAYANYADQVVVATSTSNGTTWSTPSPVGGFSGETPYAQDYYVSYYPANDFAFQTQPDTSIAYASSSTLYVAYSGGYLVSASLPYYYNYQYSGVFASKSINGGAGWTSSAINAPLGGNSYDEEYSPAIGVSSNGTPYVAYVWENNTYCSTY